MRNDKKLYDNQKNICGFGFGITLWSYYVKPSKARNILRAVENNKIYHESPEVHENWKKLWFFFFFCQMSKVVRVKYFNKKGHGIT